MELFSTWQHGGVRFTHSFDEYVKEGLKGTPIVAALVAARTDVYAEVDFYWRDRTTKERLRDTNGLRALRHPWPGGHLSDLLALTETDVQLAGQAYVRFHPDHMRFERLAPDRVYIVADPEMLGIEGFLYDHKPDDPTVEPEFVPRNEMAQLMESPDPLQPLLGRSWLTACLYDINADLSSSQFVNSYFENSATPNLIIKTPRSLGVEQREQLAAVINRRYTGADNAFKTLLLENGAEAMVVGNDLQKIEYAATRAAGETRIAAAAGIAPIVAGLREGLQAGTYSNYGQAVRKTLDWKIRPRWTRTARHLEHILDKPNRNAELWYDDSQISAVQQDALDASEIKGKDAATISALITAGFTPAEVAEAVKVGDFTSLTHTGLFSVQLQPPMTETGPDDTDEVQFELGDQGPETL